MTEKIVSFQRAVWEFYWEYGRHALPWRLAEIDGSFDPYKILVSEMMLQQTQVSRVVPKYREFLAKFPTVRNLAQAPLGEVLTAWNGLGYNRRAKFLWQAARIIEQECDGEFPRTTADLQKLPGVGANTAGAVMAYAFNAPTVFVETNIRTVFIHHFCKERSSISDKEITDLVTETLPAKELDLSRTWFWALMDYGSYLKQTAGNLNRVSKSYGRQSKFEGSRRQIRGQIIRILVGQALSQSELESVIVDPRVGAVLRDLLQEKLIQKKGDTYTLFD